VFELRRLFLLLVFSVIFLLSAGNLYAQNTVDENAEEAISDTITVPPSPAFLKAFRPIHAQLISRPFLRSIPGLYFITLPAEELEISVRPDGGFYIEKKISGYRSGVPTSMTF